MCVQVASNVLRFNKCSEIVLTINVHPIVYLLAESAQLSPHDGVKAVAQTCGSIVTPCVLHGLVEQLIHERLEVGLNPASEWAGV